MRVVLWGATRADDVHLGSTIDHFRETIFDLDQIAEARMLDAFAHYTEGAMLFGIGHPYLEDALARFREAALHFVARRRQAKAWA